MSGGKTADQRAAQFANELVDLCREWRMAPYPELGERLVFEHADEGDSLDHIKGALIGESME